MPTPTLCTNCGHIHRYDMKCAHIIEAGHCKHCSAYSVKTCECREHKDG